MSVGEDYIWIKDYNGRLNNNDVYADKSFKIIQK